METVYVSSYCVPGSYGSMFQALALKRALGELGYASRLVQIVPEPGKWYPVALRSLTPGNLAAALGKCLVYPGLQRRHRNTCRFLEEHLDLDYYENMEQLRKALAGERLFLAGSDQIWHPGKLAPEFFLEFAPMGARRLSYAASMGVLDVAEEKKAEFTRMVNSFANLSLRESDSAELISHLTGRETEVHPDPVFLMTAAQWRQLARPYPVRGPYCLVYPLYWDARLNDQLRELKEKTGLQILVVSQYRRRIFADRWIYDADPAQLLWLIDHAACVVSSSFHGAALSILLGKALGAVVNPAAPSRMEQLLTLFDVPHREIRELTPEAVSREAVIHRERHRAMAYLKEILEGTP